MNLESLARLCFAVRPLLWALAIILVLYFAYRWFAGSVLGAAANSANSATTDLSA